MCAPITPPIRHLDVQHLTVKQTAAALQLHPRTILAMIHRGDLPAIRALRHWRIPAAAVAALATATPRSGA